MKKMAIFQVDLNIGGIQKSCVNFVNNIDTKKYKVDLYLCSNDNIYLPEINKSINVKYIKAMPYLTKLIPFSILKHFYNPHIEDNYDVVIDFNSYANESAIAAIKTKSPLKIMWIHNDIEVKKKEELLYRILHFLFKSKYKYFNKFVGVSTGALNSFIRINKIKDREVAVIPNLIDTRLIKEKLKEKSPFQVDEQKINVCSVGRLVHQKGFDILVSNLAKFSQELENFHFYIIGGGTSEAHIQKLITEHQLGHLITLVGYLKNPYPLMNQMDAFILTSRYEGQGMVFLEAKSLGLDVIMPKHLEQYVDKEINGIDDIKKAILALKKHSHKFDDLKEYNDKIINLINNL